jgi:hypothetical protein
MKAFFDFMPTDDPWGRADHPRWRQYWMSLWGATIEAIAAAWGVPLQAVLEASQIASSRSANTSLAKLVMDIKVDIIRKPRSNNFVNPTGGPDHSD